MAAWKTCKLGEVCVLQRGHDLPRSAMHGGIIPVVGSQGIIGYHDCPTANAPCPGVTLGRSGSLGHPRLWAEPCWIHNTALYVKDFCGNDPRFVCYLLGLINYETFNGGGAVPTLNRNVLHQLSVSLPTLSEQERIAGVLGAYDDLIAVNVRRMALLEEAAYRLYRERFVTRADPAWPSRPIKDCCATIQSGGTPSRGDETLWTGGTIDWFKTKELQDSWLLSSEEKITERAVQRSAARLYPAGAILMAIYASPTLGRLGVLSREATCNQAALGFVVDEIKASKWWLFYTLLEERERFNQVARGAGQQNISGDIVKGWAVRTPPLSVALAFEQEVTPYWMALLTLARENALLREARDGLLPRLLREA